MEDYNSVKKYKNKICYYLNNNYHRLVGPAVVYNDGTKFWYKNGLEHRVDGPAEEYSDGYKYWWFEGKQIACNSQEEFERYIKLKLFW